MDPTQGVPEAVTAGAWLGQTAYSPHHLRTLCQGLPQGNPNKAQHAVIPGKPESNPLPNLHNVVHSFGQKRQSVYADAASPQ